jgi:hypothetical protein
VKRKFINQKIKNEVILEVYRSDKKKESKNCQNYYIYFSVCSQKRELKIVKIIKIYFSVCSQKRESKRMIKALYFISGGLFFITGFD